MKVYTITLHSAINYGAVLQAYALQAYLKNVGHETKVIDFCTPRMVYPMVSKICIKNPKSFGLFMLDVLNLPAKNRKWKKFEQFKKECIDLTDKYESIDSLRKEHLVCDAIITGSDQVFSPERPKDEREAFYLDFVKEVRKISYAASFGNSSISAEKENEIRKYLQGFFAISIREEYGVENVNRILRKKCAVRVCDPVFLIDKNDWKMMEEKRSDLPEKFILLFSIRNRKSCVVVAENLRNKTGYPIVVLTDYSVKRVKTRHYVFDAGPREFLWMIDNAQYVVTDSFHGTAFSVIFEKKVVFADDSASSNERGLTLLNRLGMNQCTHTAYLQNMGLNDIDYKSVRAALSQERKLAQTFIDAALGREGDHEEE